MCDYCNYDSDLNEYFQDYVGDWYHDVKTNQWDSYDLDFVHLKEYGVSYCQYCGSLLRFPLTKPAI